MSVRVRPGPDPPDNLVNRPANDASLETDNPRTQARLGGMYDSPAYFASITLGPDGKPHCATCGDLLDTDGTGRTLAHDHR